MNKLRHVQSPAMMLTRFGASGFVHVGEKVNGGGSGSDPDLAAKRWGMEGATREKVWLSNRSCAFLQRATTTSHHAANMKTQWKDIPVVPTSQEFLDIVLSRTQRRLPTQVRLRAQHGGGAKY